MKIEYSQVKKVAEMGRGNQGVVYKAEIPIAGVKNKILCAVKIYNPEILEENESAVEEYIKRLVNYRTNAPKPLREIISRYTTWPLNIICDRNRFKGFTMNLIPNVFFVNRRNDEEIDPFDSKFDFILQNDKILSSYGIPPIDCRGRLKITYELLSIASKIHECNFVIGDLSSQNTLVYIDGQNQLCNSILLIDIDSIRKTTTINPLKQLHSPTFWPPECPRDNDFGFIQNTKTDVYKVCLMILRLYHDGMQRSAVTKSPNAIEKIANETCKEFAELVEKGLSDKPAERPTMQKLLGYIEPIT